MPGQPQTPIDFLIITALEHEAQAVISRLIDYAEVRFEDRDIRTYHCGRVPIGSGERSYRVVVVLLPGMGELSAANATTDALTYWRPEHVLMIGIAGGIAQDDLERGDVVVADQVVGYDYGKQTDEGLKPRDHVYPSSALLLERVRNFALKGDAWSQYIDVPRPEGATRDRAKRFVGPIASGNKVIASQEFQAQLLARWPKLIAIETEAEGVFSAVFERLTIKHALVIRGISDMADKAKDDVWQLYAANAAAAYAIAFLKSGPVETVGAMHASPLPPTKISTAKLPSTSPDLFGREQELTTLDAAFPPLSATTSATGEGGASALGGGLLQIDLDTLSDEAGAAYLQKLGVIGTPAELQQASHDFNGHALALTLLGTYLTKVHRGEVRKRDLIPHLTDERKQGAHAQRMLASYETWLKGKPELDILRLMGLFDRPPSAGAIAALRKKPAIKGLTDQLQNVKDADWEYAVSNLRDMRLLSADNDDELDCHPLLREHFGEQLRATNENAFREAHRRLYEYYKDAAKELPDTLEEMAPLFAAVAHGCLAGQYQAAMDDVYWKRITRGQEFFCTKKLGAFGSDLAALSGFFDPPWRQPMATLNEADKGFVLNAAGFRLRALGRLSEAAQPMQASLESLLAQKNWKQSAIAASNLSELYLTLGDVAQAVKVAQQSVELADRSGDAFQRVLRRTTLANALHQAGRISDAEAGFREAEEMQQQAQPTFTLLYSQRGFQYCDLLLNLGQAEEVQRRAGQTLEWVERAQQDILSAALDNLSLGRALTIIALSPNPSPELGRGDARQRGGEGEGQALLYLTRAVDGLRQAGAQEFIIRGLLTRAEYYRLTGNTVKAQSDLDEAYTVATRGGMRLYEADCHLGYARLTFTQGDKDTARQHLAAARALIDQCGYHRRDGEVQELAAALESSCPAAKVVYQCSGCPHATRHAGMTYPRESV